MGKVLDFFSKLRRDEEGAALVEYTVLLGILLVAVIVTILAVGTWVAGTWSALCTTLRSTSVGCTVTT